MPVCSECGGSLPTDTLEGLCSRCLLEQGLRIVAGPVRPASRGDSDRVLREFGDYELLEEIARGGMGVVYRARQKSLDRIVAVKLLLLGPRADPDFVKRLRGEATVAAGLRHPNIVAIHEVGVRQGEHYLVMDFVDGPNLSQFVKGEPLPPHRAAQYLKSVAEAIHYAHERGVLHRDLKPSNVVMDAEDQPRVTDFGLAKRLEGESSLTASGQVVGSPSYMPPEQATGTRHHVGRRSDVYSLGAMLYHTLTGRPPFVGEELSQTLEQVLNREPVSPRLLNAAVPRDLETICLKCLEKEPARRYGTARELADELNRFLRDEPIVARPVSPPEKLWRWARRKPALATLIILVQLVGAVGLAGILWQWRRAEIRGDQLRSHLYASDMNLVQQALAVNNLGRARELLDEHRPKPSEEDLRGWEWRYLWKQCRNDEAMSVFCQQSNAIVSLAVSHDGKWLAIGEEENGQVSAWNLDTREEGARLQAGQGAALVAFSPREPLLAFVGGRGVSGGFAEGLQSTVRLWNATSRQIVASFPVGGRCRRPIAFAEDGESLVTSVNRDHGENQICFWRLPDGFMLTKYAMPSAYGMPGPVLPFAQAPDRPVFACGVPEGKLNVVDRETLTNRWSLGTEHEVVAVAFSSGGRLLASSSGLGNGAIQLWDVRSGKEIRRLESHRGWISALVFWPDGKRLASASGDQTIRLWDLGDLTNVPPPQILVGHKSEVWSLALLPDGRTLVSGAKDGSVHLWNTAAKGRQRGPARLPTTAAAWRFTPNSKSVLTLDWQGHLTRWRGAEFQDQEPVMTLGPHFSARISRDGRLAATAPLADRLIRVWDLQQRTLVRELKPSGGAAFALQFLAQGNNLLIAYVGSDLLETWDIPTGKRIVSWQAGTEGRAIAFSPDERSCLAIRLSGEASLRNMATGVETHPNLALRQARDAAFSPDGRIFAAASWLGRVNLWETASFRELGRLSSFLQGAYSVGFSPDGKRLVCGSDGLEAIKLFEVPGGRELLTLEGEGWLFDDLAFSPDGDYLGAVNDKLVLHLWRAPSWEEIEAAEKRRADAP